MTCSVVDVEDQPAAGDQRIAEGGQRARRRVLPVQQHDGARRDDDRLVGAGLGDGGHVRLAQDRIQAAIGAVLAAAGQHRR
jgi:hypothetical protein